MQRFLIFSLLFLFSCGQSKDKKISKPDDLLPRDKMVAVLSDVYLLEASLSIRSANTVQIHQLLPQELMRDSMKPQVPISSEKKDPLPYYDIFKRNEVTKKQYEETMEWYATNADELNKLYDDVIIELTKRQAEDRTGKKAVVDSVK